jgi:two-component system phosphate regulon response regulator PhoB
MAKERILVVDDEPDLLELVCFHLTRDGYQVQTATSGEEALRKAGAKFDLIILDLMLPGMDGQDVARALRAEPATRAVPVIMLTAKGAEADIVAGLELGAEDYVTKPFSPRVLTARVKAVLQRRSRARLDDRRNVIRIQGLEIDPGRRAVSADGIPVSLANMEFEVLSVLARRPGWVFTRSQIVDAVRGDGYPVTDRSVDVQVVGLRKKLGELGAWIETVRGVGYRFKQFE